MHAELQIMIDTALEHESKSRGKRFSTHQEANACIKEQIDNAVDPVNSVVNMASYLWDKMRAGEVDDEYVKCIYAMGESVLRAVYGLLGVYVMIEKYKRGVVHEPKTDMEAGE